MQIINYGTETAPKWLAVATVSIKGEEQDIIPAFTDYSIKQKDFSKDKVFTAMDKSKILPTIFCLTDAEVFIKENVKLFDYHGREIDELPEGAPRILVYLDKPDNINLWSLDIPIKAEIVECDSVADAYQRVATTAYLSQCPSKDDWIGFAGIVSKDKLLLQIKKFSNSFGMNGTAAQGYFGLDTTTSLMQSKAILASALLPNRPDTSKPLIIASHNTVLMESVKLLTVLKLTRNLNWMLLNVRIKFNAFKELSLSRFIYCTKIPTIIN